MNNVSPKTSNVRLNGVSMVLNLKDFKFVTLNNIAPWVNCSPLPLLREHMTNILGLWGDFCERSIFYDELKGTQRAQMTREMNKIYKLRLQWDNVKTREKFVSKFYQTLLTLDGLSENRGGSKKAFH